MALDKYQIGVAVCVFLLFAGMIAALTVGTLAYQKSHETNKNQKFNQVTANVLNGVTVNAGLMAADNITATGLLEASNFGVAGNIGMLGTTAPTTIPDSNNGILYVDKISGNLMYQGSNSLKVVAAN